MAREIFELRTVQKSRGWFRFRRFLDEIDRVDLNFFSKIFASSKKLSRRRKNRGERTTDERTKNGRTNERTKKFTGGRFAANRFVGYKI